MVLESLFNPFTVKKKPWEMFGAGFFYSFVGLILSYFVFRDSAGLLTVFLIVLATLPLIYTTIKNEEELDLKSNKETFLLKEHTKVLAFLIFLFLGITVALTLAYVVLPTEMVNSIFSVQHDAIGKVNSHIQGDAIRFNLFAKVFFNNLKVLFFCIVFSFLYGSGAIFILTWNASVVAAATGHLFKTELAQVASSVGLPTFGSYVGIASFSFFRYMTHGLFEMASYFVAGLAGGIISIALIKHNLENEKVLIDALDLVLLSLGILLIAGLMEVYVTPIFFA